MPITTQAGGSERGLSPLQRTSLRTVAALAFTGAIAVPLVGVAAAQSGSLGSGGSLPTPTTVPTTTTTPPPAKKSTVELQVLVLDDGGYLAESIADRLTDEGVEVNRFPVTSPDRPTITREMLADDASTTAHYMGIVSVTADRPHLSSAENSVIDAFTADYGIREVSAYTSPNESVGLAQPPGGVTLDGTEATLTPAALGGEWSYLNGPVRFDDVNPTVSESWGYPTSPLPDTADSTFLPLVTTADGGAAGTIMGVHTQGQRERLILTFAMNGYQQQFRVLSHGMISWLTRGVSTSVYRNALNVQIDDVFLADDEWNPEGNCTFGADCAVGPRPDQLGQSRMRPADVQAATTWENANGIQLDVTYNAFGAGPDDPLTQAFLNVKDQHRWINHTWDHTNLDDLDQDQITAQIQDNIDWAVQNGVPLDPSELVTGEHSGLISGPARVDNPALAPALDATGVRWVAADASVEADQRAVGNALTVPRHPMNIFYNTSTKYNAVDEYNWIYTSADDGGSDLCNTNPASTCIKPLLPGTGFDDYIVPQEARHALSHALGMDPRPHYAHQSNITGDRILYPVLDQVIADYRYLFAASAPLTNPSHSELGLEMQRRNAWAAAADEVTATVSGSTLSITNNGGTRVEVPVSTPAASSLAGTPYAGAMTGWIAVGPGETTTVDLGGDAGFRAPTTDGTAPGVSARMLPQASRAGSAPAADQRSEVIAPINDATRVGAMGEGPSSIGR